MKGGAISNCPANFQANQDTWSPCVRKGLSALTGAELALGDCSWCYWSVRTRSPAGGPCWRQKRSTHFSTEPWTGWAGVGWGEGLGFNSFNSGQSQGQREPRKPSDPLEGCPSREEVVREQVPFPRAPKGMPHLYQPLSTLSHGRRLTPALDQVQPSVLASPAWSSGAPAEQHPSYSRGHSLVPVILEGPSSLSGYREQKRGVRRPSPLC